MRGDEESPSISTVDEGEASKCSWSKDQEMIMRNLFKEEVEVRSVTIKMVRGKIAENVQL